MNSPEDYVNNARNSREEDAQAMLDAVDAGEEYEGQDADEAIDELPLSVELEHHVVIVLSTGGPHEEIDVTIYGDGTIKEAKFGAYWGNNRKETRLHEGDALWTLAERYVGLVAE